MHDQADELRRLVLRSAAEARAPSAPPPPMVLVTGGKGGVGSTTVATNLSVSLARQGHRAVLVDADLQQPDATMLCNLPDGDTVASVLSGQRTVHEVLQRGPAGVLVLPGSWAPGRPTTCSAVSQRRLLQELARLGPHTDWIVVDGGNHPGTELNRFWQAASLVILTTTEDVAAVMDAYAALKLTQAESEGRHVASLVNMATGDQESNDVQRRIANACRRFLSLTIHAAPCIPFDERVALATRSRRPFVLDASAAQATRSMDALAQFATHLVSNACNGDRKIAV